MAIQIPQGYAVTSAEPIDTRFVLSKTQMQEYSYRPDLMPPVYFCVCSDADDAGNHNLYVYDPTKPTTEGDTGKFHVFKTDYRLLANTPTAGKGISKASLEEAQFPSISVLVDPEYLAFNSNNEITIAGKSVEALKDIAKLLNEIVRLDRQDSELHVEVEDLQELLRQEIRELAAATSEAIEKEALRATAAEEQLRLSTSELANKLTVEVEKLYGRVEEEETLRLLGDSELTNKIDEQVIILNSEIGNERTERILADSELVARIDNVVSLLNSEQTARILVDAKLDSEDQRLAALIASLEAQLISEGYVREEEDFKLLFLINSEINARKVETSELLEALKLETSEREMADNGIRSFIDFIQVQINSESKERLVQDTIILSQLNSELDSRILADSELKALLAEEKTLRETADGVLAAAIYSEGQSRIQADSELLVIINNKQDKLPTKIVGRFLQATSEGYAWSIVSTTSEEGTSELPYPLVNNRYLYVNSESKLEWSLLEIPEGTSELPYPLVSDGYLHVKKTGSGLEWVPISIGSEGGVSSYSLLTDLPTINSEQIIGAMTGEDFIVAGSGLEFDVDNKTINHSNLITPTTSEGIYSITIDGQGHISSYSPINIHIDSELPYPLEVGKYLYVNSEGELGWATIRTTSEYSTSELPHPFIIGKYLHVNSEGKLEWSDIESTSELSTSELPYPFIKDAYLHINKDTSELEWALIDDNPVYVEALYEKTATAGSLGTCNVIHQNGHAFIIDLGCSDTEDALINYIRDNNLVVDGLSISHFHTDHIGDYKHDGDHTNFSGLEALLNYFVANQDRLLNGKLNLYIPHGGDSAHHAADTPGYIDWTKVESGTATSGYNSNQKRMQIFIDTCNTKLPGKINLIYPKENDSIEIEDFKLIFNNVAPAKLTYYYNNSVNSRGVEQTLADYNDFSMIVTALTKGKKIVFPGDIFYAAQTQNRDILAYPDVYFVEHHNINYVSDFDFLNALTPKVAIVQGWGTSRSALTAYLWGRNTASKLLERGIPVIHSVESFSTLLTITDGGIDVKPTRYRNRTSYDGSYGSGLGLLKGINIDLIGDDKLSLHGPGKYFIPSDIDTATGTGNWFGSSSTLPSWVSTYLTNTYHPLQLEVTIADEGATKKLVQIMKSGVAPFYVSKRSGELITASTGTYNWGPWYTTDSTGSGGGGGSQIITPLAESNNGPLRAEFISSEGTVTGCTEVTTNMLQKNGYCTVSIHAYVTANKNKNIILTGIPYATQYTPNSYTMGMAYDLDSGTAIPLRTKNYKVGSTYYYSIAPYVNLTNQHIFGSITFPIID